MVSNKLRSPVYLLFATLASLMFLAVIGYLAFEHIVDAVSDPRLQPGQALSIDVLYGIFGNAAFYSAITLFGLVCLISMLIGAFAKSSPVILCSSVFLGLAGAMSAVVYFVGFDFASLSKIFDFSSVSLSSLRIPGYLIGYGAVLLFGLFTIIACNASGRSPLSVALGVIAFIAGLAATGLFIPYQELIKDFESFIRLDGLFLLFIALLPTLSGIAVLGLSCYRAKAIYEEPEGEAMPSVTL